MLRRLLVVLAIASALLPAAIQNRLVAQETASSAGANQPAEVTVTTATEFAKKLVGDDQLTQQLRESLKSKHGALVLRDRAGYYEAIARQDAREGVIPRIFEELFENTNEGLQLRKDKEAFRAQFLSDSQTLNEDIESMRTALAEQAALIDRETDIDKLVHRFMTDESASIILYASQIRPRMRPGMQMMERLFTEWVAKRADGKYVVRPEARERLQQRLKMYDERIKLINHVQEDLAEFGDYVAPIDEFHDRFKAALADPVIVGAMTLAILESDQLDRRMAANMVNQFEGAFREGAEGLVVQDQHQERLEQVLTNLERVRDSGDALRRPLAEFLTQIATEDEFHRKLKQYLSSKMMLARAATRTQYTSSSVQAAYQSFFGNILEEQDNGRLRVDTSRFGEDRLVALISGMFRETRAARRRGREVTELTELVRDQELKDAMLSPGGKIAIGDALRERLTQEVPDGLNQWIDEHFEAAGEGYKIREQQRGKIEEVVRQIDEVEKELENADF